MELKIIALFVLFISVILHEIAHGYAALYYGDDTAKRAGRLTLDPFAHVDLIGSIVVPLICLMSNAPIFGWAKPVPVDFDALPHRKADLLVSLSGILVNFSIAIVAGLAVRVLALNGSGNSLNILGGILVLVTYMNLMLGIFNLLPIPPLDGWRIWGIWLPYNLRMQIEANAMFAMVVLFMLLPFLSRLIVAPVLRILIWFLTGVQI